MTDTFKDYIDAEVQIMIAEVTKVCPVDSPEFNVQAMQWIRENAAHFRTLWECRLKNGSAAPLQNSDSTPEKDHE